MPNNDDFEYQHDPFGTKVVLVVLVLVFASEVRTAAIRRRISVLKKLDAHHRKVRNTAQKVISRVRHSLLLLLRRK